MFSPPRLSVLLTVWKQVRIDCGRAVNGRGALRCLTVTVPDSVRLDGIGK